MEQPQPRKDRWQIAEEFIGQSLRLPPDELFRLLELYHIAKLEKKVLALPLAITIIGEDGEDLQLPIEAFSGFIEKYHRFRVTGKQGPPSEAPRHTIETVAKRILTLKREYNLTWKSLSKRFRIPEVTLRRYCDPNYKRWVNQEKVEQLSKLVSLLERYYQRRPKEMHLTLPHRILAFKYEHKNMPWPKMAKRFGISEAAIRRLADPGYKGRPRQTTLELLARVFRCDYRQLC